MAKHADALISHKRKTDEVKRPSKKVRLDSDLASSDGTNVHSALMEQILNLESSITETRRNYNNIVTLFSLAQSSSASLAATLALARIYIRLFTVGRLPARHDLPTKELVIVNWLKDRLVEFKQHLLVLIKDGPGYDTRITTLTLAMRLLAAEARQLRDGNDYNFPRAFLKSMLKAVLDSSSEPLRQAFAEEWVNKHVDIRFFTGKALRDILRDDRVLVDIDRISLFDTSFALLSLLEPPSQSSISVKPAFIGLVPTKGFHAILSQSQQKRAIQDAWLSLLSRGMTSDQRKRVLKVMTTQIAPWFTQPELLADFLTDSYDAGGATSLLALSGVFYLVTERNLEYPSFYTKLYSLLDASILYSRHRSRVFRLLDICLASSHLPAALVASFIKRLARLALSAPPSAIVFIVPWLYNLFRRHPQTTFLMHRTASVGETEVRAGSEAGRFQDPYRMAALDPMETGAMDSCIWEIVHLQSHYHPNVATIAKIVSEQFTKASYNIEDFLDHSYASLLETEFAKEVKKPPVLEFHIPKSVFVFKDFDTPMSALMRTWDMA